MLDQRCADTGEPVDPVGPYSGSGFSQLSIRIPTAVKQVITNQGSSHDLEAIGAVGHRAPISYQRYSKSEVYQVLITIKTRHYPSETVWVIGPMGVIDGSLMGRP